MRVVSRKKLDDFCEGESPDVKKALDTWFSFTKAAKWKSPTDVKKDHPKASIIAKDRVVFNILGGRYRLVAAIHYSTGASAGAVYIRFVGTHTAYNKIDAATV
jgi:mRNA interferase HigB